VDKLRPIKRWGQNFLKDKNIINKILQIAGLNENDSVLEIGPGRGILTEALADKACQVVAVEIDRKLTVLLAERFKNLKNVKIIQGDFLRIDLSKLHLKPDTKVIANIPYYISTPIIMKLLENRTNISMIVVMVQKEVAQRIAAGNGNKNYGVLSLVVQYFADVTLAGNVSNKVFFPEPKVSSSILKINILKTPRIKVKDEKLLFKVIKGSFGQRRKTLLNSLSHSLNLDKDVLLEAMGKISLDPSRRGETLTLEEFGRLSDVIKMLPIKN
jgi:16S rRNA (adenine1518-N6/adenine1519-N6)-dimethyltransferase